MWCSGPVFRGALSKSCNRRPAKQTLDPFPFRSEAGGGRESRGVEVAIFIPRTGASLRIMSFLLLAKKRICSSVLSHRCIHLSQNPPFSANDYLVSTFGFSPAKAATISKHIAHLKSPQNPDAVRSFLHAEGFSETQLKTIISKHPTILCSSLQNTIAPNFRALRDVGLSTSALTQIILSGPQALQRDSAAQRIKFWRDFIGEDETDLVKVFRLNGGLVCHDINGGIATKISLLQSHGISIRDIPRILCKVPRFIMSNVNTMEETLKRAKNLGFQPESGMFILGLQAVAFVTREALQKKMELLKSFGWSEADFFSALQKAPSMIHLSEKSLRAKMDFLLGEARCDISYIAFRPMILTLSLEKRLRPRHHVLSLLELKGLSNKRIEFRRAIDLTESKFVETYILSHKETIPELHEVYLTTCSSRSG